MPRISVVMPAWNAAPHIKVAIDSILSQTYHDFECIIVNDFGSDDGTREIVESYAKRDRRIILVQLQGRAGLAKSLNMGIEMATGEFIARMDADDYSYPERFAKQVEYMDRHPEIVLCCTAVNFMQKGMEPCIRYTPATDDELKANLLFHNPVPHMSVMFRRDVFLKNDWLYDEGAFAEDFDLWTRVTAPMASLTEPLVDYNFSQDNRSMQSFERMKNSSLKIIKHELAEFLGIRTELYPDKIIWLDNQIDIWNVEDIMACYRLLSDIEEQNRKRRYCDAVSLSKCLITRWNHFIVQHSFRAIINSLELLPHLKENTGIGFSQSMAEALCIKPENVEYELKCRLVKIDRLSKQKIKYVVWGTGKKAADYFRSHPNALNLVGYFVDSDISKQGSMFHGKQIVSPMQLMNDEYSIIISSDKFFDEIVQGMSAEIKNRDIYSLRWLDKLCFHKLFS